MYLYQTSTYPRPLSSSPLFSTLLTPPFPPFYIPLPPHFLHPPSILIPLPFLPFTLHLLNPPSLPFSSSSYPPFLHLPSPLILLPIPFPPIFYFIPTFTFSSFLSFNPLAVCILPLFSSSSPFLLPPPSTSSLPSHLPLLPFSLHLLHATSLLILLPFTLLLHLLHLHFLSSSSPSLSFNILSFFSSSSLPFYS
jgi:hypothetical protein